MPKKLPASARRDQPAPAPSSEGADPAPHTSNFVVFRETIESIVVAFVLAFLFRTFEAEAFVIPTGSMSPSLQGRHKDVECTQCGARFRTSASSEDMEDPARNQFTNFRDAEVVGGMCPMCRYPMPYSADLPAEAREEVETFANLDEVETRGSYPGDRILVNKYGYDFSEPERWDVIVFKFPGDGDMNYIKRLVGLPGEELQIYQGDVFLRPLGDRAAKFEIERKPADTVAAMLQLVHDTDYESATLHKGGWPLRWAATTSDGWKVEAQDGAKTVAQRYAADVPSGAPTAWLRYRHQIPQSTEDWAAATAVAKTGSFASLAAEEGLTEQEARQSLAAGIRPELITDFNSYNTRIHRAYLSPRTWSQAIDYHLGMNWVGDLAVDCDVEVQEARGELVLDLVEAGYHFRATIDLASGNATLGVIDGRTGAALDWTDSAPTALRGAGEHRLRFANVDDQLHLWVDGEVVRFQNAAYDPDVLFADAGGRDGMLPWTGTAPGEDSGDLAPAGIGANGAKLAITRLALLRDVYYIAARDDMTSEEERLMDYDTWRFATNFQGRPIPALNDPRSLFAVSEAWPRFHTRRRVNFAVQDEQLFVMGDNSPESADCRLWSVHNPRSPSRPGGRYLDRRLLIGKAVCVFWPHSWGAIPGLPLLPGFPNFGDMRLVR
ncbi:MAG TPA: signal peptidase I [Lacipirellulaceae bacterium]|nr:signal peptidase I [Lacipirellulaceae bacterium]